MARPLQKFAKNDIISLTENAVDYDLAESVGPDLLLRDLFGAEGMSELADLPLAYGTAPGRADLREAIAGLYNARADDVIVTAGGMHALFLLAGILCEPGDEVIVASPLFPNTVTALNSTGAEVKTLPLAFDDAYRIDLDALSQLLTPRTRLICLTSPQNPSGVMTPKETIWKITRMMEQVAPDAYLLMDETYRHAAYGRNAVVPSAASLSRRIISCASLSKCHGAPGLRIGWAVTRDAELREQLVLAKFNSIISCSTIDEALAVRVLKQQDKIICQRRQHLASGLERVAHWVEQHRGWVDWVRPDAGALCCIRLKPSAFDHGAVHRFYERLGRNGVRVACGNWFGEEARIFRLGFGLMRMTDLDAGLERLSTCLRQAQADAA